MSFIERALGAPVAAGFGLLARARGDRALHPQGTVLQATTRFHAPVDGVPATAGPSDSLVRLSRAIGFSRPVPDIFGFALRLHDLHGPGEPQDLLLASSPPPPAHTMLAPARSFDGTWFTSLLPYRVGRRRSILVVHAEEPGRFALGLAAPLRRRVDPLAEVLVEEVLEPPPPAASSFDPILHAGPAFRQDAGVIDGIRARAYRASRKGSGPGRLPDG